MSSNGHDPTHLPPTVTLEDALGGGVSNADGVEVQGDTAELEAATLARFTIPEDVDYLGEYQSVEDYLREMLEPEVSPGCVWILDHLDWRGVLARFEEDGARYFCEHGHVYRGT